MDFNTNYNTTPIAQRIGKMEKQIQNFGEILQKFGLDLIQSIGEMKHNLGVLSDKIEKIEKELIELKGLRNQLQENSRLREEIIIKSNTIEKQVRLLNSKFDQIQQSSFTNEKISNLSNSNQSSNCQEEKEEETVGDDDKPVQIIHNAVQIGDKLTDYHESLQFLKKLREEIYLATGGHRILLEIRSFEKKLEEQQKSVPWENNREQLLNKLKKWKEDLA